MERIMDYLPIIRDQKKQDELTEKDIEKEELGRPN